MNTSLKSRLHAFDLNRRLGDKLYPDLPEQLEAVLRQPFLTGMLHPLISDWQQLEDLGGPPMPTPDEMIARLGLEAEASSSTRRWRDGASVVLRILIECFRTQAQLADARARTRQFTPPVNEQ